uniref:Xylanolytic transcriptional activator regulatory domain-containing protein n=1 Tax=Schizophyllum commune (strain H4-8 / FGSC 9210) TaxID=578458 RepID=D8QBZ5_SCHCM
MPIAMEASSSGDAPAKAKKRRLQDSAKNPGGRCSKYVPNRLPPAHCLIFAAVSHSIHIARIMLYTETEAAEPTPERLREVERTFGMSVEDTNDFLLNTDSDSSLCDSKALVTSILDDAHAFFQSVDLISLQKAALRLAKYARSLEETAQQAPQPTNSDIAYVADEDVPDLTVADSHEEPITDELCDAADGLADRLWQLTLNWAAQGRYFGKSSNVHFIKSAMDMRDGYAGASYNHLDFEIKKRMEYWTVRPWEIETSVPTQPPLTFPDHSFLLELVDLYFKTNESWVPIMHRPTVDRDLASRRYLRDRSYGYLVLTMCALASRHSDDPRVFADRRPGSENSAGWQWWSQVEIIRRSYRSAPSLVLFLWGTSVPEDCWKLSMGIRLAQEVGAHRKRKTANAIEDELYKRVFWALVIEDIQLSSYMGRPRATTCEDIDLDPVIEAEDEYWLTPEKQPEGRIGRGVYFNQLIRIIHVIYSIKKPRLRSNMSRRDWQLRVVSCIDSALNSWRENLPTFLRWSPDETNAELRDQAMLLAAALFLAQIQLHRPFIVAPNTSQSFPSLAICANAARTCLRMMERNSKMSFTPWPHAVMAIFCSCIVLILYVLHRQQTGNAGDGEKDVKLVFEGLKVMAQYEKRWQFPGRLDVLYNLFPAGGFKFSTDIAPKGNKRAHEGDITEETPPLLTSSSASSNDGFVSRGADFPPPAAPAFGGVCDLGISEDELAYLFALPSDQPIAPSAADMPHPTAGAMPDEVWSTLGDGRLSSSMGPVTIGGDDSSTASSAGPSTFNAPGYHQNPFDVGDMGNASSSTVTGE